MENSNKPRDFFLHLAAFALLYFVAIALLTLLFTLIDYHYPDLINYYYADPYSGPVRFAIASLLILSPIFVVVMRMIQKETRINPDRAKLGVRKWLTYITLFIAGATAVIDLIVLLNTFLGGALPTAFALKALSLLAVVGAGFGYFMADLRGYWLSHPAHSRYVGFGFIAVVLISIVLGIYVMGSPATQRMLRMDNERVSHLQSMQYQIVNYWQNNQKLPEGLSDIDDPLSYQPIPTDPKTNAPYTYEKMGDLTFKICATFEEESPIELRGEYYPEMSIVKDGGNWKHAAGESCFDRAIDPALYKPTTAIPQF